MTGRGLSTQRPVVLADGGSVGTLGLARCVGRAGVPVHLLTDRPDSPATASRYVTSVHRLDGVAPEGEGLLESLLAVGRSLARRGVFLCASDTQLRALSPRRDVLREVMDLDFADRDMTEACLDKRRFGEMGARLGLRVPGSFAPTSQGDLEARLGSVDFPVFVKPSTRTGWKGLPDGVVESFKGVRRDRPEQVVALYRKLRRHGAGDVVVEEFLAGPDRGHVSVHLYRMSRGQIPALFCARKHRVWPAYAGVGTMIVSESTPRAERIARETVEAMGLTGFASVQMKHDTRRNRYVVHEINASRYSTWVELAAVAGCNLPLVAYAVMTGQEPLGTRRHDGIGWIHLERDLEAFRTYRRNGDLGWAGYLWSLRRVRCGAYLAWDDPTPFLRKMAGRVRRAVSGRLGLETGA